MQPNNILDVLGASQPEESLREPDGTLGRDDFLRMLIAQLENQDPLNPQEATEFSAQLAQFSTLEQLLSIRTAIEELANPTAMGRVLSAAALIGREVVVEGDRFSVDAVRSVDALEFELPQRATSTQLIVTDEQGLTVRSVDLGRLDAGRHRVAPPEQDALGRPLAEGLYRFHVNASAGGDPLEVTPFVRGRVTGAAPDESGSATPQVLLGGLSVPVDALLEVRATRGQP